jgi:hypothetical protein
MVSPGSRRSGNHRDEQASPTTQSLVTAPGSGARCDVCQQTIEVNQVEVRCSDGTRPGEEFRFHQWCYYALPAGSVSDSVSGARSGGAR